MKLRLAAASVLLLLSPHAPACTQNLDCGAGSRCLKSTGAMLGQCVAEVLPSSSLDAPTPLGGATVADQQHCSFDADCGSGRTCLKTSERAPGLCISRR